MRLVWRIREMVCFQGKAPVLLIRLILFTGQAAIEVVGGIKMDARLGGVSF